MPAAYHLHAGGCGSATVVGASGALTAAIRILLDVVRYRLQRLEMANLAGAVAIMLALRLEWHDMAVRTTFAALLNIFVYLNNDYRDVAVDAFSPDRDQPTVAYLRAHMREALAVQWVLFIVLAAIAVLHGPSLVVALALGGGICWAYSKVLKRHPFVDLAAMTVWGFAMPLCGVPLDDTVGLCLALQLGLFSSVFEAIQVVRDRDVDTAHGLRTTAVALGVAPTRRIASLLTAASALYGALVLHPVSGAVSAAALLIPWRDAETARHWTAVKVVFGLAWIVACGAVYLEGATSGLLLRLHSHATLPPP